MNQAIRPVAIGVICSSNIGTPFLAARAGESSGLSWYLPLAVRLGGPGLVEQALKSRQLLGLEPVLLDERHHQRNGVAITKLVRGLAKSPADQLIA
jgi:hypothetical protein